MSLDSPLLGARVIPLDVARALSGQSLRAGARASKGNGVTGPLSPGMIDWLLREAQGQVFALADPTPIGVTLTSSGQMMPCKTVSFVVGVGTGVRAKTSCPACGARDRCKFRLNHA